MSKEVLTEGGRVQTIPAGTRGSLARGAFVRSGFFFFSGFIHFIILSLSFFFFVRSGFNLRDKTPSGPLSKDGE